MLQTMIISLICKFSFSSINFEFQSLYYNANIVKTCTDYSDLANVFLFVNYNIEHIIDWINIGLKFSLFGLNVDRFALLFLMFKKKFTE